jgi:hypothetical protein
MIGRKAVQELLDEVNREIEEIMGRNLPVTFAGLQGRAEALRDVLALPEISAEDGNDRDRADLDQS